MKILHVHLTDHPIPPVDYGGTERVLWALVLGQQTLGHEVRILAKSNPGRHSFVQCLDAARPLEAQLDGWADIVHFHWPHDGDLATPFVCTQHGNRGNQTPYPLNTIFLSQKHAAIHDAECHVYNGLHWPEYGDVQWDTPRTGIHFLAKASNGNKNLRGAVRIARKAGLPLRVLGGRRLNLKSNKYFYAGRDLAFHGMVNDAEKRFLLNRSQALLFPVLWHEPFGLAIIESLYYGCPVIASAYGSLPELVHDDIGLASNSESALVEALHHLGRFDRRACHEYARTRFDHLTMSRAYLDCYARVLAGETLNPRPPATRTDALVSLTLEP
ncbi:MAG: glycosyltransferase [Cardiobacteriaceae bacterium]|nr:glycosyltransferase [Cardiobacteriaceae bacterium]